MPTLLKMKEQGRGAIAAGTGVAKGWDGLSDLELQVRLGDVGQLEVLGDVGHSGCGRVREAG